MCKDYVCGIYFYTTVYIAICKHYRNTEKQLYLSRYFYLFYIRKPYLTFIFKKY